jgi:hypothetical protein
MCKGLAVVVETNKANYEIAEPVNISIYVENQGDTDISVVFPSYQNADYQINYCNIWSWDKVFLQMPLTVIIPSRSRVLLLQDCWAQEDFSGSQVPPGLYSITGWMVPSNNYSQITGGPVSVRIGSKIWVKAHGGIGLTVKIKNIGLFTITSLRAECSISGGLLGRINLSKQFNASTLEVNQSISETLFPIGVGPITIHLRVVAADAEEIILETQRFLAFFIVYPVIPPLG